MMSVEVEAASPLERYVPRIATDWSDDAPDKSWQEFDATLCFVDISGFTNLSEKLARRGRIGAEELTGVLNFVFGRMLELAYLQGGSLLKFGGDALLLMFTGHDHPTRAASAAVEMRAALRAAASYETSVGKLRLKMSVGIHSGPIHLFRTGTSHRELVVAGPGGTKTTEMEKTADPGEILVSSGTRDQLPEGAATTAKGDGWLLKWRKAHCIAPGPVRREGRDPDAVRQWVSPALRDYLSVGAPEPEHRIATIGFIKFCGFDHLVDSEGLDAASDALDVTISSIVSAIDDEGVTFLATDINEDGGKVILAAGAPVAKEEDEARILRAFRRIADSDTPLDLHFGVNRGHVFTGEVGTEFRSTYTVMGDTVNLAARLMAAAPAGAIYATPSVLDHASTIYSTEALEPFHVKGKEEPVHAYDVRDELGERSVDDRSELPYTGHKEELGDLTAAIVDARDGRGSVVTVIGDTGLGKSRMIREACANVPEIPVINVHAEPFGTTTPYRSFRDPMRAVLGVERGTPAEMATALREGVAEIDEGLLPMLPLLADVAHVEVPDTPEASAIEPRFRMDRLADAVARLLDVALAEPAVINIEDAQWMDEASVHLILHFSASFDQRPWAILVSRRGTEEGFVPKEGRTIMLGDLTPEEAEELVIEATEATPLRPHEIDAIVARGGGNPLFLEEILKVVRETGSAEELPDSLGTVVSTGIDSLPPLTRRVLQYCSVLGRSFRVEMVQTILAEDDLVLDSVTRELLDAFLEEPSEGRLRFRAAMVRDVTYDGLSYRRRADLHVRAAHAIESASGESPEDVADQLAMHYSLGHEYEPAWHYARIAAMKAAHAYANIEAQAQYELALDAARRLPEIPDVERFAIWVDLGDVRGRAGLFDSALDAYRHAYKLVGDEPVEQAKLLLKRAAVWEAAGRFSTALRETTLARKIAEKMDASGDMWRARTMAFAAMIRQRQERPHDALAEAERAIKVARSADDKASLARAYSVTSWAHLMLDLPGARALFEEAYSLYKQLDDLVGEADVANNLGGLAYFEGRWADALDYYEMSRSGAERLGNVGVAGFAAMNIGEVLVNQRRLDEAESVLKNAIRVLRSIGLTYGANFAEMQFGRALMARGSLEKAESVLVAVRDELNDLALADRSYESALYLAECLYLKGDPAAAVVLLDEASRDNPDQVSIYFATEARVRASALVALSRRADALDIVDRGMEEARQRGLDYDLALLLEIDANLHADDDPDQAAVFRSESLTIFERLDVVTNLVGESTLD
jgi:class 3 adenylate cyclase/tetratricopeptide (TPR) repeat protein